MLYFIYDSSRYARLCVFGMIRGNEASFEKEDF